MWSLKLFLLQFILIQFTFVNGDEPYRGIEVEPFVQLADHIDFQDQNWYRVNVSNQIDKDLHIYVTTRGSGDPDC